MISKSFKIKKRDFKLRKSSIIQHKLRSLMKCYTIINFDINDDEMIYSFNKSHKINGLRMNDPKCYEGSFEVVDIDSKMITLILKI